MEPGPSFVPSSSRALKENTPEDSKNTYPLTGTYHCTALVCVNSQAGALPQGHGLPVYFLDGAGLVHRLVELSLL